MSLHDFDPELAAALVEAALPADLRAVLDATGSVRA